MILKLNGVGCRFIPRYDTCVTWMNRIASHLPRLLVIFMLSSLVCLALTQMALASPHGVQKRLILMVKTAESGAKTAHEVTFAKQLRFALQGMCIQTVSIDIKRFDQLSAKKQITLIRPLLRRQGADAAVWLTATGKKRVIMNIMAVSSQRALMRFVETKTVKGFEADLALAAREILSSFIEIEPQISIHAKNTRSSKSDPATSEKKPRANIKRRVSRSTLSRPAESSTPPTRNWLLAVMGCFDSGFAGPVKTSMSLGGGLFLARKIIGEAYARISFEAQTGPGINTSEGNFPSSGWRMGSGLGGFWLFQTRGWSLAPTLDLQGLWSSMRFESSIQNTERLMIGQLRILLGFEIQKDIFGPLGIIVGGHVVFTPTHHTFENALDHRQLFATPWIGWHVNAGLIWRL